MDADSPDLNSLSEKILAAVFEVSKVRCRAVLRNSTRSRPHGLVDWRSLERDGGKRSPPPYEAGGGRMGRMVRTRHRAVRRSVDRPAEHHAGRRVGRAHARHLQPPCRQSGDGQRGPTGELPAIAVSGARRQVLRNPHLPRLRFVHRAPGSAIRARRGGRA